MQKCSRNGLFLTQTYLKLRPWRSRWAPTSIRNVATVPELRSWDVEVFRRDAFTPATPAILPTSGAVMPLAVSKWFHHDEDFDLAGTPRSSQINHAFWSRYSDLIVPLEVTRADVDNTGETDFQRLEAPFGLLLASLVTKEDRATKTHSIYLAQHDIRDLPQDLRADLPTPSLIHRSGRGDLYSSSLWMGSSPTYTPLHKDPNPNLLMQLAGAKVVRLFKPEIGAAIFDHAQLLIDAHRAGLRRSAGSAAISPSFRGEEMMKGAERTVLHDLVWPQDPQDPSKNRIMEHAQEAVLNLGQALFIPKGWWHSVKGLGSGVTASANWWFR